MKKVPLLSDLPKPPAGMKGWPWTEASPPLPDRMEDGNPWPRITIVTPSYNQGEYIEKTIRSVLLQGYPNLEYMIFDGGSTDGAAAVIEKYGQWLDYWESVKDRGQSHAINKGLKRATGAILNWLNSDDYLLPNALSGVARLAAANPGCVAWAGACRRVDPEGRIIAVYEPRNLTRDGFGDWYRSGYVSQPACFFSMEAVKKIGYIDEDIHWCMDYDYLLRLASAGPFASTKEVWCDELWHSRCKNCADSGLMKAMTWTIQIRHGYQHIAVREMASVYDEWNRLRLGSPAYRLLWNLGVAWRTIRNNMRFGR